MPLMIGMYSPKISKECGTGKCPAEPWHRSQWLPRRMRRCTCRCRDYSDLSAAYKSVCIGDRHHECHVTMRTKKLIFQRSSVPFFLVDHDRNREDEMNPMNRRIPDRYGFKKTFASTSTEEQKPITQPMPSLMRYLTAWMRSGLPPEIRAFREPIKLS